MIQIESASTPPIFREILPSDYDQVHALAKRTVFLAKHSWKEPPEDMIIHGLRGGTWHAYGFFDTERLASYVDFTDRGDELEIGFGMTPKEYRRRGLMDQMFGRIIDMHPGKPIVLCTAEGNTDTHRFLDGSGFTQTHSVPNDRVDRTATHYYRLDPGVPFRR